MPEWNELFKEERFQWQEPAKAVVAFAQELRQRGARRVLDLGFGAGRHVVYLAREGFEVYGTDISPRGLELTKIRLQKEGLHADLQLSDMTVIPYPDGFLDAIISTYVIHHNILDNIRRCVAEMHRVLAPGGRALLIILSKRGHKYGKGKRLEPDTFVPDSGDEAGVPHHFFDETSLRELFAEFTMVKLILDEWDEVEGETHRLHSHWIVTVERGSGQCS